MSVVNLQNVSNDELKKILASLTNLEDWADDCSKCGYPRVLNMKLHRETACTREQELPNILNENWREYRKRVKPILKNLKEVFRKEAEQGVLLDGLERLITKISGQNVDNMKKYTENMTMLVTSFKDSFKKDEASSATNAGVAAGGRVSISTKPAKVPSWTKDMSLETYTK